jgi:hypothetical protein
MTAPNKHDSNITGLAFAEEVSLKLLPGVSEADAIWNGLEPNSYSDFGGSFTNVARKPINASRQIKKGVLTDLDASGGFNSDFTQNNMQRLLQGFFFADAREKANTKSFNGAQIAFTGVTGATKTYAAASGLGAFLAGSLFMASGFGVAANNGLDKVASSTAGTIVGTAVKTDEAAPPADAKIETVGFEFDSDDISLTASASNVRMTSLAVTLTTLGLIPGEWIFIGGDAVGNKFAVNKPGYARVKAVTADYIDFDDTTFAATTEAGTGKSIQIFFGKVIKNELSTLIKRRSYQLERQLGNDGDGIQSEYLLGAIPNELTLNIPEADKLNADLSFVALDYQTRTGTQGVKAGTRVNPANEDAFNTSSDVYRMKMNIVDPLNINGAPLFAYVTDGKLVINNGVTPNKAIGVLGAFDAAAGDFAITGSITAYFSTVAAVAAVRNNSDVGFNVILANKNAGFVFDIPLMSLGGGRLSVEKDAAIKLPIEMNAAENGNEYTLLSTFFSYLPNIAMPV